ncbi:hypothetical protein [Sphingomonas crocodyli]|uniref:DUF2946 domain-containing protein n=1 Tax=Sphingomonas crocodyli TaxID=1979270 RepID=A0A437M9L6_9SPHN|nr:hypothetical protein [Sphingomonas crocodyli]RVT94372.1 hypothetical protein EOD43_11165 [Sphingomonas crocodyli]
MRHLLNLLIAITMIWCGSHWCGEAQAAEPTGELAFLLDDHMAGDSDDADKGRGAVHGGHHHCPLAIDQRLNGGDAVRLVAAKPVARSIRALIPRGTMPLLEPPSA